MRVLAILPNSPAGASRQGYLQAGNACCLCALSLGMARQEPGKNTMQAAWNNPVVTNTKSDIGLIIRVRACILRMLMCGG
jgi:hypothetical protein